MAMRIAALAVSVAGMSAGIGAAVLTGNTRSAEAVPVMVMPAADATARADRTRLVNEIRRLHRVANRERARADRLRAINVRLARSFSNTVGYVSPNERAWRCVRYFEAGAASGTYRGTAEQDATVQWNIDGPIYDTAYQMDRTFQRNYGSEFIRRFGWAPNWPRWAMTITADRGLARQGWPAWPNTSRKCGLR